MGVIEQKWNSLGIIPTFLMAFLTSEVIFMEFFGGKHIFSKEIVEVS